jgi:hypothetical protein
VSPAGDAKKTPNAQKKFIQATSADVAFLICIKRFLLIKKSKSKTTELHQLTPNLVSV